MICTNVREKHFLSVITHTHSSITSAGVIMCYICLYLQRSNHRVDHFHWLYSTLALILYQVHHVDLSFRTWSNTAELNQDTETKKKKSLQQDKHRQTFINLLTAVMLQVWNESISVVGCVTGCVICSCGYLP